MSQDKKGGVYWLDDLVDLVEHRHNKGLEGELYEFELEGKLFTFVHYKKCPFLGIFYLLCFHTRGY